jgi:Ca2+-transporting ATPase
MMTAVLQMMVVFMPFAQDIMKTTDLDGVELLVSVLLAGSVFPAVEVEKFLRRRRSRRALSGEAVVMPG